jgi:hypothetical protein
LLSTSCGRHITSCSDTKRPRYATSTDTCTDTQLSLPVDARLYSIYHI